MTISKQKTTIQHIHGLGWWTIASNIKILNAKYILCSAQYTCTLSQHTIHISYLISYDSETKTLPSIFDESQRMSVCVCALYMRIRSMNCDAQALVVCLAAVRVSFVAYFVQIGLWFWFILLIWKQVTMKCKDNRCHLRCDSCVSDKIRIVKGAWLNDACDVCVHLYAYISCSA